MFLIKRKTESFCAQADKAKKQMQHIIIIFWEDLHPHSIVYVITPQCNPDCQEDPAVLAYDKENLAGVLSTKKCNHLYTLFIRYLILFSIILSASPNQHLARFFQPASVKSAISFLDIRIRWSFSASLD